MAKKAANPKKHQNESNLEEERARGKERSKKRLGQLSAKVTMITKQPEKGRARHASSVSHPPGSASRRRPHGPQPATARPSTFKASKKVAVRAARNQGKQSRDVLPIRHSKAPFRGPGMALFC